MLIATLGDGTELRLLELRHAAAYHQLVARNYTRLYWLPGEPTAQDVERRLRAGLNRFAEGAGMDGGNITGPSNGKFQCHMAFSISS